MYKKVIIGRTVLVVALGIFFLARVNITGNVTGNVVTEVSDPIEENEAIKIPLSQISEKAEWYEYENVKYFVVRGKDGSIKTAFDACDVCYRAKKGYSQQGDDVVCNNCGNYYPISGLGTKNLGGGCWPGYLENTIEGDYIVIKKSDLDAGEKRYFS